MTKGLKRLRWTADMHRQMEKALVAHGRTLDEVVADVVARYMSGLVGGRMTRNPLPDGVLQTVAHETGANREAVIDRLTTLSRQRMKMQQSGSSFLVRRAKLAEYARAGVRSPADIDKADAGQLPLAVVPAPLVALAATPPAAVRSVPAGPAPAAASPPEDAISSAARRMTEANDRVASAERQMQDAAAELTAAQANRRKVRDELLRLVDSVAP